MGLYTNHCNLLDLCALLLQEPEVRTRFSVAEVKALFGLDYHLKHVDTIFRRVLGTTAKGGQTK